MTDVTTAAVSSSSSITLYRAGIRDGKKIASGSVRVELRSQREPVKSPQGEFRVRVTAKPDFRDARKIADALQKKFFEPVALTYEENRGEYAVLIGQFKTRVEADRMVERLRKAGYNDSRIWTEQKPPDSLAESVTDTNARAAKYKAQPTHAERTSALSDRRSIQLVAISSDKVAASSEEELVISSTASAQTTLQIGGKDYRGEIHLILNPRGRINVVNALPLEAYLRGVVPLELPPWTYPEIEALKAQAVAARSYALARLGQHRDEGYDLVDDARAQVYGGVTAERELSNRAVDETRGMVAAFPDEGGRLAPIEALYTANCGGRTENNEEVFGGKPVAYLRAVACSPDRQSLSGREIVTDRAPEALTGTDGRPIAREVAMLSVLRFSLPRRLTAHYLRESADRDEIRNWLEFAARIAKKEKPDFTRSDVTRLADFARLLGASIYGEGYATTLLAPADVDYLLGSLHIDQLPREARSDVAMLLRDGVLRLPADASINGRATITRGQAIETLARALLVRSQAASSKLHISDFKSDIAAASDRGRLLIVASSSNGGAGSQRPRFASMNASAPGRLARPSKAEPREVKTSVTNNTANTIKSTAQDGFERSAESNSFAIAEGAWLFRALGGENYPANRLLLIGGESVSYHLNAAGKVDFLEATTSRSGATSDRFSRMAEWKDRISLDELQQRLARAHVNVGRLESIEPVNFSSSSRVTEVEITGDEGHARLRRPQIRGALGLKESLFVVDRETDARGRVVAFVFTGRGWGHGVGMCQTGAYGLARDGYSYAAILKKYYTGVTLQRMY